jgi:acetate kinase
MNILVINCGSSSFKYQLLDMDTENALAKGLCERIGIDGRITHETDHGKYQADPAMPDHAAALQIMIDALLDKNHGVIKSLDEIHAVGHRVVHGGELFTRSVIINDEAEKAIEACAEMAPLHNPPNLVGIRACKSHMPGLRQVAVFDTAFHQTMPPKAYIYALPYEYYTEDKVRRYGFHGTSHRFVSERAAQLLNKPITELKLVTCHLGNGSSLCAVDGGRSIDSTMGLTPLEGVPMGTRSGSIDPAIIEYLCTRRNMTVEEVTSILNKKSGVLGISGVSSDFRDLDDAANNGNERAKLALDIFDQNVKRKIGALAAGMGGLDALVFTAGVGENNATVRALILEGLEFMGIEVDMTKNTPACGETDLSVPGARVRTLVIPTNEELVIALDTQRLAQK